MRCPYCAKELAETAIRCRFCRKSVKGDRDSLLDKALRRAAGLFFGGRDPGACNWSFLDIILFTQLILLFIFYDPFNLAREITDYLRLSFPIVTKEPKLLFYLTVYIKSILLYGVSFSLVVILVKIRGISFWRSVISGKEKKLGLLKWLPLYVVLCILLRAVGARNPLIPNIPLDSVFQEARILGNSVIILTTLFFAPFVEEIIFRGYLYPAFNRYLGILPSVIFTSALFTLAHYPHIREDTLFLWIIMLLGVTITYARAKTGSTWVAIVMHHVYNLVCIIMGFAHYLIYKY